MAKEGRNMALVLLGIVVIVAVVGLILLYSGAKTGESFYYPNSGTGIYQYSSTNFYPSAREACLRAVQCQDGHGGVLVSTPTENPAVCACPEHFFPTTVFDWTALRRGEMPAPRDYNKDFVKKIVWQPQGMLYADGSQQVYENPSYYMKSGTYTEGYRNLDQRIS